MRYEIINERTPEDYTTILTTKVRWWHSFISGKEETKEFLCLSGSKTKGRVLEVYEVIVQSDGEPVFRRLLKKEEKRLWKFVDAYRNDEKVRMREQKRNIRLREAENKVAKEYSEYFTEPINGPQSYRVSGKRSSGYLQADNVKIA